MNKNFYVILLATTLLLLIIAMGITMNSDFFTRPVIMFGTMIISAIFNLSYTLSIGKIMNNNAHRFVGGVMLATFSKFFLCIIALLFWLVLNKDHINKPDVFYLMFVYVLLAIIETSYLTKQSNKKA